MDSTPQEPLVRTAAWKKEKEKTHALFIILKWTIYSGYLHYVSTWYSSCHHYLSVTLDRWASSRNINSRTEIVILKAYFVVLSGGLLLRRGFTPQTRRAADMCHASLYFKCHWSLWHHWNLLIDSPRWATFRVINRLWLLPPGVKKKKKKSQDWAIKRYQKSIF